jgi:hypothetical protein
MKKSEVIIAIVDNAYLLPEDKFKAIKFISGKFEWRCKELAKEAGFPSDWLINAFDWPEFQHGEQFWCNVYDKLEDSEVEAEDEDGQS